MKYINEEYFNKELEKFFDEHEADIMIRVDDITDKNVTITVGFGDGSNFYTTFGSLILGKGWKATINSPKLKFNLKDWIHFSF